MNRKGGRAHLVLRSTDRIMIFCRRSYMCPDAMVKMCTASGSSSADRRGAPAVPSAWPPPGACPGASHDATRPHSDPAYERTGLHVQLHWRRVKAVCQLAWLVSAVCPGISCTIIWPYNKPAQLRYQGHLWCEASSLDIHRGHPRSLRRSGPARPPRQSPCACAAAASCAALTGCR